MRLRYIVAFALAATLMGAACSPKIDRSALIGRYVANHGKGLDVIDLRGDGTYDYTFRQVRGREIRNAGRWTFYRQGNSSRITFRDFVFGLSDYGGATPGYWDVEVEHSWLGKLRLPLDPDLNYYYLREE